MDLNNYIESGILESYLLGEVSEQERREVECLSKIYPEIQRELEIQEKALHDMAMKLSRPVPQGHKEGVMKAIAKESQNNSSAKVIDINRSKPNLWIAAASIAAAVVVGFLYFSSQLNLKDLELQYANLEEWRQELLEEQRQDSVLMAHLTSPQTQLIRLEGTENFQDQKASVFWNSNTRETYVVMEDLSPAPKGLNYQLWAIVDGQPVDMGVYDSESQMIDNLNFDLVDAFAITLEKEGGSPTPNLDQLVVIGNV